MATQREECAEDFTLLRSAELAQQHGFLYFVIMDEKAGASLAAFTTPTQSYTTASAAAVTHLKSLLTATAFVSRARTNFGRASWRIA